jgi:tRNA threonylcarbamoyladenosine biosynthesis protein TsaE
MNVRANPAINLRLADAAATEALGARIAQALIARPGLMLELEGDLGTGKTTLARGLLRALGVTGTIRSPTYTLMEVYAAAGKVLLHMDLYRLTDPLELHNLGISDYPPAQTWWLVEWPERGAGVLPPADLRISLSISGAQRIARLEIPHTGAEGQGSAALARTLRDSVADMYEYIT